MRLKITGIESISGAVVAEIRECETWPYLNPTNEYIGGHSTVIPIKVERIMEATEFETIDNTVESSVVC
jgi:hypothetical protein